MLGTVIRKFSRPSTVHETANRGALSFGRLLFAGSALAALSLATTAAPAPVEPPLPRLTAARLDDIGLRVARDRAALDSAQGYIDRTVTPVAHALRAESGKSVRFTRQVAVSVVRHSNRLGLDHRVVTGVVLEEDPDLLLGARSSAGATGLMQVMPFHQGIRTCRRTSDRVDMDICFGTHVLATSIREAGGDLREALRRYNGCVRGSRTPGCGRYPDRVLAHAESLRNSHR